MKRDTGVLRQHVTALALAVARYWPDTLGNVVDPALVGSQPHLDAFVLIGAQAG